MGARVCFLILALMLLLGTGCLQTGVPMTEPRGPGRGAADRVLWIDWAGSAPFLNSPAAAKGFCERAASSGFNGLALELGAADGADCWEAGWLYRQEEEYLRAAAEAIGLRIGGVLPMFLAEEGTPRERLLQRAVWEDGRWRLTPDLAGTGAPHKVSPADPLAREQALRRLETAARQPVEFLLLTGAGFEDPLADLSPLAKREFLAEIGGAQEPPWPQAVVGTGPPELPYGPAGRGVLWQQWVTWRAALLAKWLQQARAAAGSTGGAPSLLVMVDAPYAVHQRLGINWAAPDSGAGSENPWLPASYAATAGGHLADGWAAAYWEPGILDVQDAEEAGIAWWGSVEGSAAVARKYTSAAAELWSVVPAGKGRGWPEAAAALGESSDGIIILSASAFLQQPGLWEAARRALAQRRP